MKEGDVADDAIIVTCNTCNKSFNGFNTEQAYGCDATASDVEKETLVTGHYGSDHDLMVLHFIHGALKKGNACDTCIETAVKARKLTQITSYAFDTEKDKTLGDQIKEQFPKFSAHDIMACLPK